MIESLLIIIIFRRFSKKSEINISSGWKWRISLFSQHLSFELFVLLDSPNELLDLIGEQLPKPMTQFDERKLTCLVVLERSKNFLIFLLKIWVNLSLELVTFHEISREFTDLSDGNCTLVVSITGIVDIPTHIPELHIIDENICKILNCLRVVNYNFWDDAIVLHVHMDPLLSLKN